MPTRQPRKSLRRAGESMCAEHEQVKDEDLPELDGEIEPIWNCPCARFEKRETNRIPIPNTKTGRSRIPALVNWGMSLCHDSTMHGTIAMR